MQRRDVQRYGVLNPSGEGKESGHHQLLDAPTATNARLVVSGAGRGIAEGVHGLRDREVLPPTPSPINAPSGRAADVCRHRDAVNRSGPHSVGSAHLLCVNPRWALPAESHEVPDRLRLVGRLVHQARRLLPERVLRAHVGAVSDPDVHLLKLGHPMKVEDDGVRKPLQPPWHLTAPAQVVAGVVAACPNRCHVGVGRGLAR
mmetsp:Transcript_10296/g.32639  ORF Transcript_10296/g.32639 Transcript_10296/m.32639 type:complete len:202 (+) Transcript_10296:568-1173(+)